MPSNKSNRLAGVAAKRTPSGAAKATNRPTAATRRAKTPPPAADSAEAKHRRASEMLRQLRDDVGALSANADRLLRRFPL